jgi:23S rRNA (guanosine2251-2'-O)-methyltransferase
VRYQVRECTRPECRFRFPVNLAERLGEVCPHCGAPTAEAGAPFAGHQVKAEGMPQPALAHSATSAWKPPAVEALLDNIRSTYNVGSLFRTADGAGLRRLHLCGITATPDQTKVAKTALGAEQAVAWTFHTNAVDAAVLLKGAGMRLWALEGGPTAVSLLEAAGQLAGPPILLIVGNELAGVDPDLLALCDRVFHLPMLGVKGSLNVATAFGVAAYFLRFGGYLAAAAP